MRPSHSIGKAVQLKPDFAEAQLNLGLALEGSGQLDEAITADDRPFAQTGLRRSILQSRQRPWGVSDNSKKRSLPIDRRFSSNWIPSSCAAV